MRVWRPKDPRAVNLIKLTLWAGLVTWIVFNTTAGIVFARLAAILLPKWIGVGTYGQIWTWIVPIWIVFVALMLDWAVARFAVKRLRPKKQVEEEEEEE
jgi:heme/copper-type cytochrome/quinol oxidase subunit 2